MAVVSVPAAARRADRPASVPAPERRVGSALLGSFGAFQHRPEATVALRQLAICRVEQLGDLGLHQLLVEQLAAGDAIDLRAQCRDAVLVGLLHARLARRRGADQIVAQDQIGGCKQ